MRGVLYLRMSTDEQDGSIAGQRAALVAYAEKEGHEIVGEYVDEGISGDATEKRLAFQRMLADCGSRRFDLILTWDQDRFGRFDPLEAGFWIKPMRDAGVVLETIAQGRVDWNDFAGRIVWSVTQEAKHAFLRDLAGNVLRGNIARAKRGLPCGRTPYGYAVGPDGRYVLGEPDAVATVRQIFDMRLQGLGYWLIAQKLNDRRVPTPSGKTTWSKKSIREIVLREVYTGVLVFGQFHSGKYKSMHDGAVVATKKRGSRNASPIRTANAHEPIVSRSIWEAAQRLNHPAKPHATRKSKGAHLAGLLVCGLCDSPMYAMKDARGRPIYRCSQYHTGRGCVCCTVPQSVVHADVAARIRDYLIGDCETVEQLAAEIAVAPAEQVPDVAILRRQLKALDRQIEEAGARLLTVNAKLVPTLEAKMLELYERRDAMLVVVNAVPEESPTPIDVASELMKLASVFDDSDAAGVRQSLSLMLSKIVARIKPNDSPTSRTKHVFDRAELIDKVSSKGWHYASNKSPLCMRSAIALRVIRGPVVPDTARP